MTLPNNTETMNEEPIKEDASVEEKRDSLKEAMDSLSNFKEREDAYQVVIDGLKKEVEKKETIINKLVAFHKEKVAKMEQEHGAELSRIKTGIKNALINDHE